MKIFKEPTVNVYGIPRSRREFVTMRVVYEDHFNNRWHYELRRAQLDEEEDLIPEVTHWSTAFARGRIMRCGRVIDLKCFNCSSKLPEGIWLQMLLRMKMD